MRAFGRFLALTCLVYTLQPIAHCLAAQPVWSLKGEKNTIYLLGSMHFLKPSEQLPPAVEAAYKDAETLIMEIDLDDLDPADAQAAMLELGLQPQGESLEQELGTEAYAKVAKRARELGLEPAVLDRFRPWFAGLTLVQIHLMKMGLDPNAGVEQRLAARAGAEKKPVLGLETLREQLSIFAALPEAQQREFLLYSVEDADRATREVDALVEAWRRGDGPGLEKLLTEGFEEYPDLYRPLTIERNRKWIPRIEDLLDDAEDYLVVVGALHLVGENSVIDLLSRKGHKITQH